MEKDVVEDRAVFQSSLPVLQSTPAWLLASLKTCMLKPTPMMKGPAGRFDHMTASMFPQTTHMDLGIHSGRMWCIPTLTEDLVSIATEQEDPHRTHTGPKSNQ